MCGIFLYIDKSRHRTFSEEHVFSEFMKIQHRGPDNSTFSILDESLAMGFHRLAINDLSWKGNQPMMINDVAMICNGEIYNHEAIKKQYKLECTSNSDCETVLMLYNALSKNEDQDIMDEMARVIDGEYAFLIYDKNKQKVYSCRDPFGVRPLFIGYDENVKNRVGFASELKALDKLFTDVHQFLPGTYMVVEMSGTSMDWTLGCFHDVFDVARNLEHVQTNLVDIFPVIRDLLINSVRKRMSSSDRPMCALLSGGLDSSLVCGILSKYQNKEQKLHTFSIGISSEGTDIQCAREVAKFINSEHHEVIISAPEMLRHIEKVIYITETFDITTIRASIPHYLVSKYIKEHTDFKIVFSGELSDEQFGGYLYFKKAPNEVEFTKECTRLLDEVCYFDNLRADRCISFNGLEARVPFSDLSLVKYVSSIDPSLRMSKGKIEKFLLRKAFENEGLIPESILNRQKEAFSDGVSKNTDSWYKIIQNHIESLVTDEEFLRESIKFTFCIPDTKEAYYYRKIYHHFYTNQYIIPNFWRPKWVDQMDPSARELAVYTDAD